MRRGIFSFTFIIVFSRFSLIWSCFRWLKSEDASNARVHQFDSSIQKRAMLSTEHSIVNSFRFVEKNAVADGIMQLFLAVKNGQIGRIKSLLGCGIDVNCVLKNVFFDYLTPSSADYDMMLSDEERDGFRGYSPLMVAAQQGETFIVNFLWHHNARVNQRSSFDGVSALHLACSGGYVDCVQFLLYAGAQVNQITCEFVTPLLTAIFHGHSKIVPFLLDAGANVNVRSKKQLTPLWLAAKYGLIDVIKQLLSAGATPEVLGPHKYSALNIAAYKGHKAIVKILLDQGADIEHRGSDGATALYCALRGGNAALAHILIECGADTNALFRGKNILDLLLDADFVQHKTFISEALRRGFSRYIQGQLSVFSIESDQAVAAQNELHQAMSEFCAVQSGQRHFLRELHFLIGSYIGGALSKRDICF